MAGIANEADDFISGLSSHLETLYKIQITTLVALEVGVFRVDQALDPSWVARVFSENGQYAAPHAEHLAAILTFLQQSGFTAEKCAHEKPVSTFRNQKVLVTEYIQGHIPKICEETYFRLGDLLGQLHEFPLEKDMIGWKGGAWHHLAVGGPEEEIAAALGSIFVEAPNIPINEHAAYVELREELERVNDFKNLPVALVHPDFVPSNIIEVPDHSLIPIDWTGSGRGPRIFSLGWLVFAAGCHGTEMIQSVIEGYRSHISMESDELSRLSDSIFTRQLTIACWKACNRGMKVVEIVREIPIMRKLGEKYANVAKVAFEEKELQRRQTRDSHDLVPESNLALPEVGSTSLFTAAVRAEESKRSNRLFDDPLAQAFVSHWKYTLPIHENTQRVEALRKFIVARTVFFDELIMSSCQNGCRQVVLVGAGMDARSFRLPLTPDTFLFELDTADLLDNKTQVLKELADSPVCSRIIVPCDLRSDWSAALVSAGFDVGRSTIWIIEGVLVYLEEETVHGVLVDITRMSAAGSRMGLDMASHDQSGNMPWRLRRSTAPPDPVRFMAELGWIAEVTYTRDILRAHGRVPRETNLGKGEKTPKSKAILLNAILKK
jgi:methyltransferase (TIGR00027 family)